MEETGSGGNGVGPNAVNLRKISLSTSSPRRKSGSRKESRQFCEALEYKLIDLLLFALTDADNFNDLQVLFL
jgi:hypothetical protein